MAFDVPAGERREPSAAERWAARGLAGTAADDGHPEDTANEPRELRTIPLKAVTDTASFVLIFAGLTLGTVTAWIAGGNVPGMATLAGSLIMLGFLLNG